MTVPTPPDPNASIKAETERLTAQAALERARADHVKALGLPSFEGKTTLGQGGGAIESLLLAAEAVEKAADRISSRTLKLIKDGADTDEATRPEPRSVLVLAGDEAIDFGLLGALRLQLDAFQALFDGLLDSRAELNFLAPAGLGGGLAMFSAIAGLLRADSEVTGSSLPELSSRVLAIAVAGRLNGRAILPSGSFALAPKASPLVRSLVGLASDREKIAAVAAGLQPADAARHTAGLARFDAFLTSVMTADATGKVPLLQGVRLEQFGPSPLILRVYVEKAGGSLVNLRNIGTFLGFDPVRVSGGLVASFVITEPGGHVLAAEVLTCRTRVAKLREIQRA